MKNAENTEHCDELIEYRDFGVSVNKCEDETCKCSFSVSAHNRKSSY